MFDPVISLALAAAAMAMLVIIFWPDSGLLARIGKASRSDKRILMEDALKHVYECEAGNITCTYKSLAGDLELNANQIANLIMRLKNLDLVIIEGEGFRLTRNGRDYALRIIRVHRLLEKYLAEETGIPEVAWHKEADRHEHKISDEEADELSRKLGYPRYDPHGDPIPTRSGDLPELPKTRLNQIDKGRLVKIVHIEDEPSSIYAELVEKGFSLGMQIRVDASNDEIIDLTADGRSISLSPLHAANISVKEVEKEKIISKPYLSLAALDSGETGRVITISRSCRGSQRRRLMDLGVVPGTLITAEMKSITGDPTAYNIRGAMIALRRDQSELIYIEREKEAA